MKGRPMKRLFATSLVLASLLSGCVTTNWHPELRQAVSQGNCAAARDIVSRNVSDPGEVAALHGSVFADCDRNMAEAYRYLTVAARYGHQGAREVLMKQGRQIPSPDLAPAPQPIVVQQSSDPFIMPLPANRGPVKCDSRQTIRGSIETTCR